MEHLFTALIIIASYLLGSIPFALLIAKHYGVDIRKVGSGNVGATNVTRSVGKGAGRFCFFCDFAKGALPPALVLIFAPCLPQWCAAAAGVAAILGHVFPVFLKFKGGKGISTAAGAIFSLAPLPILCAIIIWIIVFKISGFVSLGSIVAAASLPCFTIAFALADIKLGSNVATSRLMCIFTVIIAILAIWRHRENIQRLIAGTESSFKKTKNTTPKA
jgi:glycerol-3-phosphate acyltransferase PlsY